jgi:hypothetical protein
MANETRASSKAREQVSRSMLTRMPGEASSTSCVAASTITGRSPFFSALARKMSAIDELTTARKP